MLKQVHVSCFERNVVVVVFRTVFLPLHLVKGSREINPSGASVYLVLVPPLVINDEIFRGPYPVYLERKEREVELRDES